MKHRALVILMLLTVAGAGAINSPASAAIPGPIGPKNCKLIPANNPDVTLFNVYTVTRYSARVTCDKEMQSIFVWAAPFDCTYLDSCQEDGATVSNGGHASYTEAESTDSGTYMPKASPYFIYSEAWLDPGAGWKVVSNPEQCKKVDGYGHLFRCSQKTNKHYRDVPYPSLAADGGVGASVIDVANELEISFVPDDAIGDDGGDGADWAGFTCGFSSSSDPTGILYQDPNIQLGALECGPWTAADVLNDDYSFLSPNYPHVRHIVICGWIQVNSSYHVVPTSSSAKVCAEGDGVAYASGAITYTAASTDNVYLCTQVDMEKTQGYIYDEDDNSANGHQCRLAISAGDRGWQMEAAWQESA